jgi:hypothetical protein
MGSLLKTGEFMTFDKSAFSKYCPSQLCDLPIEGKVRVVLGSLILVLSFLGATVWSGFLWLLAAVGVAAIYGGITGNCMLTKCLAGCCSKSSDD